MPTIRIYRPEFAPYISLLKGAEKALGHPLGQRETDVVLAKAALLGHTGRRRTYDPHREALSTARTGAVEVYPLSAYDLVIRRRSGVRSAILRLLRTWRLYRSQQVDQLDYPACVGATIHHWRRSLPVYGKVPVTYWLDFYNRCKERDGYNGPGTDIGTALDILRDDGLITGEEFWYRGPEDNAAAWDWLANVGGLAVGWNITESMFRTRRDDPAAVEVVPPYIYGHEMYFNGIDRKKGRVWGVQSWGLNNYGVKGRFYVTFDQWDQLMAHGGDAVGFREAA